MSKKKQQVTEFTYTLKEPLKIASGGEEELLFKVKLKSPTARQRMHMIRLKQGFLRAVMAAQRANQLGSGQPTEGGDESDITGEAIMQLLYISDIDLAALEEEFRDMLLSGICELKENLKLGSHHLEHISLSDFEGIMGDYFANFILSSSM